MTDQKKQPPKELHVCMGLNSCKNHGYSQNNECAGQGDCATVNHPCHTLNECKGQGGCGLFGTSTEFCTPSQNECKYQGSCGSPIVAYRYICQGPNKGKTVWQLARKRFEEKRDAEGKTYGDPPEYDGQNKYGPTNAFMNKIRDQDPSTLNESCGQAGNKFCSYAPKDEREGDAMKRVEKYEKLTKETIDEVVNNCPKREY